MQDPFPKYLTVEQVAKYLRTTPNSLKSRVQAGTSDLPLRKLGHGLWVVYLDQWHAWLEGTRVTPSDPEVSAFREAL